MLICQTFPNLLPTRRALSLVALSFCTASIQAQEQAPVRRTPGVTAFINAINLAPVDAVSLVAVPDAKSLGEDMTELASKLERMHALTEMKPLDLLKSWLGVGPGMNDHGMFIAWFVMTADKSLQWCALIPTTDSAQFLQANLQAAPATAPDAFVWRGKTVYTKSIDGWVVVSQSPELARSYATKPGLSDRLKIRLGERGFAILCDGEIGLWAGPESLADMRSNAPEATRAAEEELSTPNKKNNSETESKPNSKSDSKLNPRNLSASERVVKLMSGLTDGVTSIDVDPLGVLIRTYAVLDPESELGKSARGGAHTGANLNHLPRGPFVAAMSADIGGLGGTQSFLDLAAQIPGGEQVPGWVEQNKNVLTSIQFGIYPSKLGVVGGGLLNEAMLWMASAESAKAKSVLEQWMMSLSGEVDGLKREVTWEKDRALKNGTLVDAYTVKEIPLPKNGQLARKINPMERIFRTLLYGPKGPKGFVKAFPDGVLVTFSQRPDVFQKAASTATGTSSLETDAIMTALRGWMMPKPDALAFVGVGSLLNVVRQAANMFPIGGFEIPDAPPDLEPIAFALSVDSAKIETSTMIPTNVIGVVVAGYADRQEAQQEDDEPSKPDSKNESPVTTP
ncbi:MAG: hypothetical protein EXS12_03580 [Phycisphaerales bacterium]|nr:hypothetical protein [Phycisphaerales bacterium]